MRVSFASCMAYVVGVLQFVLCTQLQAQERQTMHVDLEVDPIAYAANGYSLHGGVGFGPFRLDIGAYAMDYPALIEPTRGLQTAVNGFGLKFQYFPFWPQNGGFVGAQVELAHTTIESERSDAAHRARAATVGAMLGWRFMLIEGLYVSPWVLFTANIAPRDVHLDGLTHEGNVFNLPFPTIHVGYRFL